MERDHDFERFKAFNDILELLLSVEYLFRESRPLTEAQRTYLLILRNVTERFRSLLREGTLPQVPPKD
jgi:hypothetical protein